MNSGDVLDCLKVFSFSLDRWGDDHLDVVHFLDVSSAAHAHASAQSTNQVLSAVGDGSRTKENLL